MSKAKENTKAANEIKEMKKANQAAEVLRKSSAKSSKCGEGRNEQEKQAKQQKVKVPVNQTENDIVLNELSEFSNSVTTRAKNVYSLCCILSIKFAPHCQHWKRLSENWRYNG